MLKAYSVMMEQPLVASSIDMKSLYILDHGSRGSEVLTSSFVYLCFAYGSPSGEATREFIELNTGQQMMM